MDENKRLLYRIDVAKVQQKIYDMYPSNSVVRRQMLNDAKAKEIERINNTMQNFPFNLTEVLLEQSLHRSKTYIFTAIGWLVGFSASIFCIQIYVTTILEFFLLGGLGGFCLFKMIEKLILAFKEVFAAQKLSDAMANMIRKFEDLKKKTEQ